MSRSLQLLALLPFAAALAYGQAPAPNAPAPAVTLPRASAPATAGPNEEVVDARLHADAVRFLDLSGARKNVEGSIGPMVEEGSRKIAQQCPTCNPQFAQEWARQMRARFDIDRTLSIYAQAYEHFLDDKDLSELIALQQKQNAGVSARPSPELRAKLTRVMPDLMTEISARTTVAGAKLGGAIAAQIHREHPDWTPAQAPTPKP